MTKKRSDSLKLIAFPPPQWYLKSQQLLPSSSIGQSQPKPAEGDKGGRGGNSRKWSFFVTYKSHPHRHYTKIALGRPTWTSEVTRRLPGGRDRINLLINATKIEVTTSCITFNISILIISMSDNNYMCSFSLSPWLRWWGARPIPASPESWRRWGVEWNREDDVPLKYLRGTLKERLTSDASLDPHM